MHPEMRLVRLVAASHVTMAFVTAAFLRLHVLWLQALRAEPAPYFTASERRELAITGTLCLVRLVTGIVALASRSPRRWWFGVVIAASVTWWFALCALGPMRGKGIEIQVCGCAGLGLGYWYAVWAALRRPGVRVLLEAHRAAGRHVVF
jgi:hypothetical protein